MTSAPLSIYIPRVDTRHVPLGFFNKDRMAPTALREYEENLVDFMTRQFVTKNIGTIKRIDLHSRQNSAGYWYYIAFVHFNEWYDSQESQQLNADILQQGTKAEFWFSENNYWICNKNTKPASEPPTPPMTPSEMHALLVAQAETIADLEAKLALLTEKSQVQSEADLPPPPTLQRHNASGGSDQYPGKSKIDWGAEE